MAKNDGILIDSILETIDSESDIGKQFDYFSISQILKDYDLSDEELQEGIVDGENDGGIDGIYTFTNDKYILDLENLDSKSTKKLEIYFITCKHDDSFKMNLINDVTVTLDELLNLSIEESEIKSQFNSDILSKRHFIKSLYGKVAPYLTQFSINIIYASRGNYNELAENVIKKSEFLVKKINDMFSSCSVNFQFIGSEKLIELYRKQRQMISTIDLKEIITCDNSYIALCSLDEYYKFITDEQSKLKRYYLDSNVRSYMGLNRVNSAILKTLNDNSSPDFWFLNNGITILSDSVTMVGKTANISNAQIVNGLQTTETIYDFFQRKNNATTDERNILLKIIVSNDNKMRDEIIASTNNQTSVELYSLKATDKIQRDIDEYLLNFDIYYERRTNYYFNQGIPKSKIITPLQLAYGYVTTVLKLPYKAVKLKSKFMSIPSQYDLVFSTNTPLEYWRIMSLLLMKIEMVIKSNLYKYTRASNMLKNMRCIVLFISLSKYFGKFNYNIKDIINMNLSEITDSFIETTFTEILEIADYRDMRRKNKVFEISEVIAKKYKINDIETIINRPDLLSNKKNYHIDEELIEKVMNLLPAQPWPKKINEEIAKNIGIKPQTVSHIINILISSKRVYNQIDGELFDLEGNRVK